MLITEQQQQQNTVSPRHYSTIFPQETTISKALEVEARAHPQSKHPSHQVLSSDCHERQT